jgi:hypothetical protein
METKTIAVGQEVCMVSGVYSCRGRVIEVTSDGVTVDVFIDPQLTLARRELLRFDSDGKGRDRGTHECGPWYLVL